MEEYASDCDQLSSLGMFACRLAQIVVQHGRADEQLMTSMGWILVLSVHCDV